MNILIVDFEFPEPDKCSGGHRLYHIIKLLREAGHKLAFLSIDYWQLWNRQSEKYPANLGKMGVRIHRDGHSLSEAGGDFINEFGPDVVILSKHYMANMLISYLRVTHPSCRLIVDTVDVHWLREKRKGGEDWKVTKEAELAACETADRVWAITDPDAATIASEASRALDIHVVPNIHNVKGAGLPFERRKGIAFVGNYIHEPNVDAVRFLSEKIVPALHEIGCEEGVLAVGPYETQLPNIKNIAVTGFVEDLDDVLQRVKVGIAPLRYGAGMKGKIGSYMCNGLPVVTTSIGAEGMSLTNGQDALIEDDPLKFAEAVQRLCTDRELWESLSGAGAKKVTEWSSGACKKVIAEAISFV